LKIYGILSFLFFKAVTIRIATVSPADGRGKGICNREEKDFRKIKIPHTIAVQNKLKIKYCL